MSGTCSRIGRAAAATTARAWERRLPSSAPGDCLVVWKLDRLGRSLPHLLTTVTGLKERGIAFRSLTEQIDTTTPQGELLFHIFGALAQFERALIQERVQAGLAAARRRGRRGGRPVVIDAEKLGAVIAALDSGATKAAVCRTFGIRRSTLIDSLARIGWSAGLNGSGGMSGATAATERNASSRSCSSRRRSSVSWSATTRCPTLTSPRSGAAAATTIGSVMR